MNISSKILVISAMSLAAVSASAITPRWLRDVKISPDGSRIAFCYRGDIYTVPADGGSAIRLTSQPDYESVPVWSPDGRYIAFATDRNGNNDIYIIPSTGGQPRRLTYKSVSEIPEAFTPDGKAVVFSASIQDPVASAMHPSGRMTELYEVSVDGGAPRQILGTPAQMMSYLPDGKSFIYQDVKGFEDEWRKHHTSSVTRDLWLYDASTGNHTNLTNRPGEDRNPVVATDGKTVYFLAERDGGSMNVYSLNIDNPEDVKPITSLKDHPVRFLSAGADGTLALAYDGDIYTLRPGGQPKKVAIDIVQDWEDAPIEKKALSKGAESFAIAPDGKDVAVTVRGEVLATSVEYSTTRLITSTPGHEDHVQWGATARELIYDSDAHGDVRDIYVAKIKNSDDPNFPNATAVEETRLIADKANVDRSQPKYSPDHKKLAFVQDRNNLMVMDMATKSVKQLTDSSIFPQRGDDMTFAWSPDGKWIVMEAIISGREPYSDILLVNVETGEKVPVTQTGYFDGQPRWALDGQAILFLSERYGMRNHASWGSMYDAILVFLNQEAYDKFKLSEEDYALKKEVEKASKKDDAKNDKKDKKDKKGKKDDKADDEKSKVKATVVEPDDLEERIVRLTPNSSDMADAIITPDGETLYYLTSFEKGQDLWKISLRKDEVKLVSKLNGKSLRLFVDDKGDNLFIAGPDMIKKMDLKGEKLSNVTYRATMQLDPAAEREYMFRDMARQEQERFYTKDMHGVDWPALTEHYAQFLPHISNNYDYAEMLSELLGELNVSHTGGRYYPSFAGADRTASLGLLYDLTYTGPGLKIAEVVKGGPLDRAATKVAPGVVVEAVDGVALTDSVDPAEALRDLAGRKTRISLLDPATSRRWEEVLIPISSAKMNSLLYDRWVAARAADVERWSDGRLGYVHIPSMGDDAFRKVYADLLGKYAGKEGVVVDIRWNGGGRLHEDIEVLLSGEKYLTQEIRGQQTCDMPSRRWNKPSVMLMAEACYSNAHGTPWVYKHQGIGKLVGMPVPGTMTSVNWVTMQDPSLVYGIPVIGYRTAEGTFLENSQLEPDVKVANDPAVIVTGEDQQLRQAVMTLLDELK